jgi:hypothetical protein
MSKYGGNVHDQGLIAATASSICGPHPPKNATDLHNRSSCFQPNNEPNSWICYDFKEMEIMTTHSFFIHQIRTPIRSQGVEKCQAMVNHGLKFIDVKTIQI